MPRSDPQKPEYPTSYQQAAVMMAETNHRAIELQGVYTALTAHLDANNEPVYQLNYRFTPIISWHASGLVVLSSGGWPTPTTAHKMSLGLGDVGRVSCKPEQGWLIFAYHDHAGHARSIPFRNTLAIRPDNGGLVLSADSGAAVWH